MIQGIIIGFLTALILCLSFYSGYSIGRRNKPPAKAQELTEEQKERMKRMNKGLNEIMTYDINTAYGRVEKWKG